MWAAALLRALSEGICGPGSLPHNGPDRRGCIHSRKQLIAHQTVIADLLQRGIDPPESDLPGPRLMTTRSIGRMDVAEGIPTTLTFLS